MQTLTRMDARRPDPGTVLTAADTVLAGLSARPADVGSQFITFTLGSEEYGVDIMAVREIKGWSPTTPIPNSPRFIHGVINLRGVIVPILDLRVRFDMVAVEPTAMHVIIITAVGTRTTGLLVDAVSDILSVAPDAIRPVPDLGAGGPCHLLTGLVALDDRMVSLVSLDGLIGGGHADVNEAETR